MRSILIGLFCLMSIAGQSQTKFAINGYVRDSASGESIIGATIAVSGLTKTITTNQYGYYSITLDSGAHLLMASHVSYFAKQLSLSLQASQQLDFLLTSKSAAMNEVVVYSRQKDANVKNAQMGKIDLSISQIKSVPAFMGEVDILKTIQLLPGVRNAGEGNAGFYVRGGGPDQNLILLDDAIVYNTGHLFGFFSIFNSDAIKNVSLIKGGMPAQYGGRISSVLDISMKDGNSQVFTGEGGIGAISSRLSLQGPILKNKSSFIISGRRTYIDALLKPFVSKKSNAYGSGYFFYDLNTKANFQLSEKDRLFLSGYFGRDVFAYKNAQRSFRADIPWGNSTATLRWNHIFNRRLFANTTLVYNDYNFTFGAAQNNFELALASGIKDGGAKIDFDYYPAARHKVRFGGQSTLHKFIPNVVSGRQDSVVFNPSNEDVKYALENGLYIQDDWDITSKLKVNVGLRWSSFSQKGPYTRYIRDQNENKLDSIYYSSFQTIKNYSGFEPRFTIRYTLDESTSLKAAITRNLQFTHLVSNSGTTLPTDLWVPSTFMVKPQTCWQYSAGIFKNFNNNQFETSLEVYYKDMRNQIEYKEGYTPALKDPEVDFVFGRGWSYGSELFINKVRGRLTGWIGYTLSWTWRKFDQLNGGEKFPAKYDRRHDLSIVGNYELSPKWKLGSVFVYGTGNATSLPVRFYFVEGVLTQEYSKINQYRLAPYHRLDISATYTPRPFNKKRFQSSWVFGIYNVYSRLNPYFVYFDQDGSIINGDLKIEARQVSLFPILPSVTWNFKF
ncbi:TonB-dependent receptor [Flavisolibacter tropicus]|uniref:TonB-dependent receptor n=1 Tax=Flavisolibacter tropicus TaxID=1492898 RepID=A0A172TRB1_9BACT|nr:TonB-dependent receptor [Flavisolibacter tropicus]ANE49303.1 TonB-dependent receptor [Flavisolibacter tropicus]